MMQIQHIAKDIQEACNVPLELDKAGIGFTSIDSVNWPADFPYHPQAGVRMAYTEDSILLHYRVTEDSVRAKYGKDNGNVWTDSCVEFFSIPAGDGIYYNLECNCIGTILLGAGAERSNRTRASQQVMDTIKRWASLGRTPFDERIGKQEWEVALIVPFTAFFMHNIQKMTGCTIRANFYKCGDELQQPHFLSWNPIRVEKPNFHLPEYFGEIQFA